MKILIWSQHFWPENFCINELAQQMVLEGHEITVLTGKPNYPEGIVFEGYEEPGINHDSFGKINIIRLPLIPRRKGTALYLILNYLSFIISGYILAPFCLRKKKFDHIFVYATSPLLQALPAIFLAKLKGIKLTIWVQDLWPASLEATGYIKNKFILKAIGFVVKYIYKNSDTILIQSEAFRSSILAYTPHKTAIYHLANPTYDFINHKLSSQRTSDLIQDISQHFSIIYAGNIGTCQSLETIISAAALLKNQPQIKIYLIGSGSMTTVISELISLHNLTNVVMFERIPQSDMSAIFNVASGLLVSLKRQLIFSKTIPSKLQSYFSAGKPIIGSIDGEGRRLIDDSKSGLSVPAEDPSALAQRILDLYALTPQEREELSKNARKYYEAHYQVEIISHKLTTYLEKNAS